MHRIPRWSTAAALGFLLTLGVAALSGYVRRVPLGDGTYRYSEYLQQCAGWDSAGALLVLFLAAGFALRPPPAGLALGCALVPALATAAELVRDPTSHSLLGLEVVLYWGPLFLATLAAAALGRRLRGPRPDPEKHPS